MRRFSVGAVAAAAKSGRADRPATAVALDTADVRAVVFRLEPGQQVAPHTSASSVLLIVAEGQGYFSDAAGEQSVGAGDAAGFEPGELHGMRAGAEQFEVLAVIAPRPGTRNAPAA